MKKRLLLAITALLSGVGLSLIVTVISLPVYLSTWGAAKYGTWLLLSSSATYLATLDCGMQMAAINRMTTFYANGDISRYRDCQDTAMSFYLVAAFVGTVLMTIAVVTLPIGSWLGVTDMGSRETKIVLWLLAAQVAWNVPCGFISAIYRTVGKMSRAQWMGNTQKIVATVLTLVLLVTGHGMVAIALLTLLTTLLSGLAVMMDLRRSNSDFRLGLSRCKLSTLRSLAGPSSGFVLMMVANTVAQQLPLLLVSRLFGPASVTLFSTTRTMCNFVRQLTYLINNAIWFDVTRLLALGNRTTLALIHNGINAGWALITVVYAATMWFSGDWILAKWSRSHLHPDAQLLHSQLVALVIQSPWLASGVLLAATNRHRSTALRSVISGIAGIALAACVAPLTAALWVVPLCLITPELMIMPRAVLVQTCELTGQAVRSCALRIWGGIAVAFTGALLGSASAICLLGKSGKDVDGLLTMAFVCGLATLTPATTIWYSFFTKEERSRFLKALNTSWVSSGVAKFVSV